MTLAERLAILVVITFCGAILFWCAATAKAEDTYWQYTDAYGTVWFVDDENKIPDNYADEAKEYEHAPYSSYDYFTPIDALYTYDEDFPPAYLDDERKLPVRFENDWPEGTIPSGPIEYDRFHRRGYRDPRGTDLDWYTAPR